MKVLVTGGAGYIGSHSCVELLNAEFDVIVYNIFFNSKLEFLKHVIQITYKKLMFDSSALVYSYSTFQLFTENYSLHITYSQTKLIIKKILCYFRYMYKSICIPLIKILKVIYNG
ncbi:NAD-dependent epimerase/dehydratase family protein [Sulfurospirillum diekertiae]|uniref:UDP-glucose 4-epimerase n=1 Tax=Sulfurospirillum diekertiae TaxID=1854492 RepID=A0A1Y0HN30_9BACT|nr:NAD-dependent epimerase/dehydratase family protein [Sulfurospirillum diekertiae]ARU49529.1 UDP-glucose 4-epimerase [Sulfurospirillum diekertiae]ASC94332.1 UDP-glucose 4-epimerase [Sulfurospirillum diekertiae]